MSALTQVPAVITNEAGCFGFEWIGQSFEFCEGCGLPFWEHTHISQGRNHRPVRNEGGSFKRVLTQAEKDRCRAKWEGYSEFMSGPKNRKAVGA